MNALPCAHGGPPLHGRLKLEASDFRVIERLGFAASGHGEHDLIEIEKTGANTPWVGQQLARHAGVDGRAVGWAGLKDRHGCTRQSFSVQTPGRQVDWSSLAVPGVTVLGVARHDRKLRIGALRGNAFEIRLRELEGAQDVAEQRLLAIRDHGFPNYFGPQRFGRQGHNLDLAAALLGGRRLDPERRGYALSAARSALYNAILAQRVSAQNWDRLLDGDVCQLDGSASIFGPITLDDTLTRRCAEFDLHPTAALWGLGELRSAGPVAALEQAEAEAHADWTRLLQQHGLKQERRATRARATGLQWEWLEGALLLRFELPPGCYATSLIRELMQSRDPDPAEVPDAER